MSRSSHMNHMKVLVAAMGMAAVSTAMAANTQQVHRQSLVATPTAQLANELGLGAGMALKARSSAVTRGNTRTVRMQQTYRGVPVYGHSVAVVQDARGNALRTHGQVLQGVQVASLGGAGSWGADGASEVRRRPDAWPRARGLGGSLAEGRG